MNIDDHIRKWVFGAGVVPKPLTDEERDELRSIFAEPVFPTNPAKEEGITERIYACGRAHMAAHERKSLQKLIVGDASFAFPDARCASTLSASALGVDLSLLLLIHNIAVLVFSCREMQFPDFSLGDEGLPFDEVEQRLIEQIFSAINRRISCMSETLIPNPDRLQCMMHVLAFSEVFIVFHEVAHLVLPTGSEPRDRIITDGRHSFFGGFAAVTKSKGTELSDDDTRIMWNEELAADQYACRILKALLEEHNDGKGSLNVLHLVLHFLFHIIDLCYRAGILDHEDMSAFFGHPPPFSRLQSLGVPYELFEPHAKYFAPEPYSFLTKLFDMSASYLNITLIQDSDRLPVDAEWISRGDNPYTESDNDVNGELDNEGQ